MGVTYKPSSRRRARTCGFRVRNRKAKHILKNRRLKGRWLLTPKLSKIGI